MLAYKIDPLTCKPQFLFPDARSLAFTLAQLGLESRTLVGRETLSEKREEGKETRSPDSRAQEYRTHTRTHTSTHYMQRVQQADKSAMLPTDDVDAMSRAHTGSNTAVVSLK